MAFLTMEVVGQSQASCLAHRHQGGTLAGYQWTTEDGERFALAAARVASSHVPARWDVPRRTGARNVGCQPRTPTDCK